MKSVYIHIPFCHSICNYCDFCKMYYDKTLVSKYLEALEKEIKQTYKGEAINTIYIGGGTPSHLNIEELNKLFDILKIFDKSKIEEYTIESNVESLDEDKLKLFKDNGINRISIGVQSFNHKLLTILGRNHTYEMVIKVINDCKKVGLTNINVDLIYGINNETMDDLKEDLYKLLKLDISHVSLYSLIIEPHTKLYLDKFKSIDEDMNADMYDYINKVLKDNNYQHYEISNYAKRGYESRHNLVYWHNLEYYGFGLSAASFIDHNRYENTRSFNRYIDGFYKLNDNILSEAEMISNEMILGLRLLSGVNKEHFYQKYNKRIEDVYNIANLIKQGLLIDNGINIYISEDKLFISNSILLNFLD